jgi:hypothetical protein
MRGFPLWRCFLLLLSLGVTGFVVHLLTRPQPVATPPSEEIVLELPPPVFEPIEGILRMEIEAPAPPTEITVTSAGELVFIAREPGPVFEVEQDFIYPVEGFDLVVRATWEDHLPGPRAVRLQAFFDGTKLGQFILWGEGEEVREVWEFPSMEGRR